MVRRHSGSHTQAGQAPDCAALEMSSGSQARDEDIALEAHFDPQLLGAARQRPHLAGQVVGQFGYGDHAIPVGVRGAPERLQQRLSEGAMAPRLSSRETWLAVEEVRTVTLPCAMRL